MIPRVKMKEDGHTPGTEVIICFQAQKHYTVEVELDINPYNGSLMMGFGTITCYIVPVVQPIAVLPKPVLHLLYVSFI